MKKVISMVLVISLFVSVSVGASAVSLDVQGTQYLKDHPHLSQYLIDDYESIYPSSQFDVFGVLPVSELSDQGKQEIQLFWDNLTGLKSDRKVWIYYLLNASGGNLVFSMFDSQPTYILDGTSKNVTLKGTGKNLIFELSTGKFRSTTFQDIVQVVLPFTANNYTAVLVGDWLLQDFANRNYLQYYTNDNFIAYYGSKTLVFADDVNPPEIPDPEPEPSQPPPVTPEFPTIGDTDNQYIPYKTSHWNSFLLSIRTAIGNSTNIGLIILGMIFSILLIIRIVKWFARV